MKKLKFIVLSAFLCGLVVLTGCSESVASGSAASSDAPLGRTPAIFAEVAAKKKALNESLRSEKNVDAYQKKIKQFDEYAAKSFQKAADEAEKIIGRSIKHTSDSEYPDFNISEVKVTEYHSGDQTGTFVVRCKVSPKHDIMLRESASQCAEGEYSLRDTRMYFVLLKENDQFIALGEFNPFSGNNSLMSLKSEYSPNQVIHSGDLCHSEGSPFNINCHSYDFTEFAKIAFVTKKGYLHLRKQAFGF